MVPIQDQLVGLTISRGRLVALEDTQTISTDPLQTKEGIKGTMLAAVQAIRRDVDKIMHTVAPRQCHTEQCHRRHTLVTPTQAQEAMRVKARVDTRLTGMLVAPVHRGSHGSLLLTGERGWGLHRILSLHWLTKSQWVMQCTRLRGHLPRHRTHSGMGSQLPSGLCSHSWTNNKERGHPVEEPLVTTPRRPECTTATQELELATVTPEPGEQAGAPVLEAQRAARIGVIRFYRSGRRDDLRGEEHSMEAP